jgi:hypothetical protein
MIFADQYSLDAGGTKFNAKDGLAAFDCKDDVEEVGALTFTCKV